MPPVRRRDLPAVPPPSLSLRSGAVASLQPGPSGVEVVWNPLPEPQPRRGQRKFLPVSRAQVKDAWQLAHQRRAAWLQDIHRAPAAAPAMPKDLSAKPRTFHMRAFDETGCRYVGQLADIGQREGFTVVADTCAEQARALREGATQSRTLDETLHFGLLASWAEDDGSIDRDGNFNLPARLEGSLRLGLDDTLHADRMYRLRGLDHTFQQHGAVAARAAQRLKVSTALALGRPVRENLSYVEGGNCIVGTRQSGESYALVGRDSVAVTRALLTLQTQQPVSQRTALRAIAKDLGLSTRQVYPVEQPFNFHLDLAMVAMAPGQVLLNDAHQATDLYAASLRRAHARSEPAAAAAQHEGGGSLTAWRLRGECVEARIECMRRDAERQAEFEGRAVQDLRAAGLCVVRVPAVFPDHNFLNGEGGTSPRNERFFITQGGEPWLTALIADLYLRRIPTGLQRVYFLDADACRESLEDGGGLGCRAVTEAAAA